MVPQVCSNLVPKVSSPFFEKNMSSKESLETKFKLRRDYRFQDIIEPDCTRNAVNKVSLI